MLLVLQVILLSFLPVLALHNGDYFFILAFPISMLGVYMNWLAASANGGKMPVKMYIDISHAVWISPDHQPMTSKTRYKWLCDYIRIGRGSSLKIVSIGDLFVFFGCTLAWIYVALLVLRGSQIL